MSGKKLKRISEFVKVSAFAKEIILKRECNRFRIRLKDEPDICECGYTRALHSPEALQNEFNQTEPSMKTSPTDAFGKLLCVEEEEEDPDQNCIRYVRLDWETDVNSVLELIFRRWKMKQPSVIISVVSDNDRFTDKTTSKLIEWICSRLVEAAASTSSWIITGGLNKGVDKLIGDEVNRKRGKHDKNVQAVLGICHWGCLEHTNLLKASSGSYDYASNSNPTGLSLDQHHTHFLLVDDGKQKKSDCEWKLRQNVELSLKKPTTSSQLVYILIGGGINSLRVVKHALEKEIPVVVATGTGGAADVISTESEHFPGYNLEKLPEIFEKLLHRLDELLVDKSSSFCADKKFLFDEIAKFSGDGVGLQQSKEDVTKSKRKSKNRVSYGIKNLFVSKQTSSDRNTTSAANVEFDRIQQTRDVVTQMLVAQGIPSHNAKQAADDLEPLILNETLENVDLVVNIGLQESEKKDLLVKIKLTGSQGENIINFIADVLNNSSKVAPGDEDSLQSENVWTTETSSQHTVVLRSVDIYMVVAAWNDEAFFRKLLLENWMSEHHQTVLEKLLKKGTKCINKYAELMVAHNSNSAWLTEPNGRLAEDFKQNKMCERLLKIIKESKDETTCTSLREKMLFIWCIKKEMPETAMLFWIQGKDCLAMVLFAYHMSKKKMKSREEKEGYEEMKRQMEFFSDHAINLLNACYADNHQNTHHLLVSRVECLKEGGPLTPLQIAEKANFGRFISTVPVQDLLNKIWTKGIKDYKKSNYIPMILSEACPLLAPALFKIQLPDYKDGKKSKEAAERRKGVCGYFRKVKSFLNTPCVKFSYGLISYILYLLLFSVVMLTGFRKKMSRLEMLLSGWTFVLLIEEIKQAVVQKSDYLNIYNFFDIGAIIIYIVGFSLRVIYQYDPTICPVCLYLARIVLAFSLLVFFIRTLPFLSIFNDIGPKIYMMGRLIADLMGFMLIMVIFVSAYGVVTNIIMYPNQPLGLKLLHDIYYDASWSVLGQFNREEISGSLCSRDNDSEEFNARRYCKNATNDNIDYVTCKANRCPANNWIVGFLLTLYALFMIIMLLNILIAMFNATFSSVKEREKAVSKMQQYQLIRDYSSQSMVPVPLCVITYPYVFVKYLLSPRRERTEPQYQTSTGDQDTEAQSTSKDQKQNEDKSISYKSEPKDKAFEKNPKLNVARWERAIVAKYYKETKDKNGRNETSK